MYKIIKRAWINFNNCGRRIRILKCQKINLDGLNLNTETSVRQHFKKIQILTVHGHYILRYIIFI